MDDYSEREVSSYNEAGLQIQRLDNIWRQIETMIERGLLVQWRWKLDSIWRELYADVLRQPKSKELIKENESLKKQINMNSLIYQADIVKNKGKVSFLAQGNLYLSLNSRHEFLKALQDGAGKGGSYESSSESDFD